MTIRKKGLRRRRKTPIKKLTEKIPKHSFASGFEHTVAKDLKARDVSYEYEKLVIEYNQIRTYTPDFRLPNGIIVETKGKFTGADRTKHLLVKAQHPEYDIRIVFMRDNYLSKKSKKKYSDWCTRNNIKWALHLVPQEWIDEQPVH